VRREENVSAQQSAAQGAQAAERLSAEPAAGPPGNGEGLGRQERVRRRREYLRAYRRGRRRSGALATLHFAPNDAGMARVGVTVSRKVGNSVVRHRVKRRVVEIFRRTPLRSGLPAWDFVVHLKPEAARADFAALRHELEALLRESVEGRR